jgi:hypothetical protein
MSTVFDLLEREWRGLASDRAAARRLRPACEAAGGAVTLEDLERYVRSAGPADADRVLVALVARAVEGDGLSARVLLQLLLPGARRLANRRVRRAGLRDVHRAQFAGPGVDVAEQQAVDRDMGSGPRRVGGSPRR